MSQESGPRARRPIWMVALLALALPFLTGACSGSDTTAGPASADPPPSDIIESGDLTGFDVKVHQAVG